MSEIGVENRSIGLAAIFAMLRVGLAEGYGETAATIGRALTYGMIISVMWSIWRVTPLGEAMGSAYTVPQLVWYVGLTELVIFSTAHLFKEVQDDIRSGALTCQIVRPVAWPLLTVARWYGRFLAQLSMLAIAGFGTCLALTGAVPLQTAQLPALLMALLIAGLLGAMAQFAIGTACLWVGKSEPVYWIWQKCLFVLGGLLIPLGFYPDLLAKIAWYTPFPAMIHVPAIAALGANDAALWQALAMQGLWLGLGSLALWGLWRAMLGRIGRIGD